MTTIKLKRLPSSFRDPNGFVFEKDGQIYRYINSRGKQSFDLLKKTGLYKELLKKGYLLKHNVDQKLSASLDATILKPEQIPFITYPYEWSFSQLKEAAIITLKLQSSALDKGMTLKDASAYNIQFLNGQACFIDILSIEKLEFGRPWVAYRQFCEHFFTPLALMANKDLRLTQLQYRYLDGIPLDLAVNLLPLKSFLNKENLFHLLFHSLSLKKKVDKRLNKKTEISSNSLKLIIENLITGIERLQINKKQSYWKDYYDFSNYSPKSFSLKKKTIEGLVKSIEPKILLDLGANTGVFSKIAAKHSSFVVSTDYDPVVVEANYCSLKRKEKKKILSLVFDVINPTPAIGWDNKERESFLTRIKPDCVMALALLHHLVISNNLSFEMVSNFLSNLTTKHLIIEFVDTTDSQVKDLFAQRGVRKDYSLDKFEKEFGKKFKLLKKIKLERTSRILYLYRRNNA